MDQHKRDMLAILAAILASGTSLAAPLAVTRAAEIMAEVIARYPVTQAERERGWVE